MKSLIVLICLSIFSLTAIGSHHYYPEKFHSEFMNGTISDSELASILRNILISKHIETKKERDQLINRCNSNMAGRCYGHKPVSYHTAKKILFGNIHLEKDEDGFFIKDLYCEIDYRKDDFEKKRSIGPNQVPDHNIINCEHTWPKYRFSGHFSRNMQEADMHHLFPTNSRANSARGHYTFAEVDGNPIGSDCTSSLKGHTISGSGKYRYQFEPPKSHRGNVARALFYFSVRYNLRIDANEESFLRKWHQEDPVDKFEEWRNDQIWQYQGNRNPFIDYPHLVDRIDNF